MHLLHVLPAALCGAGKYRFANQLRLLGVLEGRMHFLTRFKSLDEIGDLVHECVLVADLQTGHPPLVHVGMLAAVIGHMNRSPSSQLAFVVVIEPLQPMQVVEVPTDRSVLTVDLEGVQRFVTAGVPGRLEQAERTVLEVTEEGTGVIDPDRLHLSRLGVHPFLHERLGHGRHISDRTVQPNGSIDAVSEQVAGHAGTGGVDIQSPQSGSTLGHVLGDGPVLQEVGAIVEDPPQSTFVDQLLGHRDRRNAAIVVPDGVEDTGLFDRIDHRLTLCGVQCQRFLAKNHLARFRGGDRDLGVEVVGCADVDRVNVIALDQFAPIRFDRLVLPLVGEGLNLLGISTTDRLQTRVDASARERSR